VIPLVRAHGTHTEAGAAIGTATAAAIRRRTTGEHPELATRYREVTTEHLPWVVEELDAAARAADVDPLALFAASVEELEPETARGCTDVVVGRLVAHNNDLAAADEEDVVAIEWRVANQPAIFTLGIGPWISVGWNEAGLSVTGNELDPNDERVGIPRLLQVRDVLTRTTLDDAVDAVLHPARASSYNWVLASPEGAVNVEGSATAAEIRPLEDVLVHTNHYEEPPMQRYARKRDHAGSRARYARAHELAAAGAEPLEILRDHANAPNSICGHGRGDGTKTVFWCVADVEARRIEYGHGNPCASTAQVYAFA
jgi:Acyl-coenzyme A:6-aminopenicillanic acid acyl-transferase